MILRGGPLLLQDKRERGWRLGEAGLGSGYKVNKLMEKERKKLVATTIVVSVLHTDECCLEG